ncbi:chromatin assembly factor 1 subunit B [Rhodotorula toruloides]|uniref:Chromatin assembly factor 1 subunit B n=1 Tax=Rhodotorula toruloides TaxID=5286 RepID=A0A511KIY9_RHOTO|nr:chromatin assembly factor 1 subunit B [Rhodotorula toruloides]
MKCKTLEIRWHDKTPIFSADFHPLPPTPASSAAKPSARTNAATLDLSDDDRRDRDKRWRLATCGADNNVRLWLVTPRPFPQAASLSLPRAPSASSSSSSSAPKLATQKPNVNPDPSVEYLATLSQHMGVVNCVRWSPKGDMLASAGDDGNILLWVPSDPPSSSSSSTGSGTAMNKAQTFGETDEDRAYEKESWRVRAMIRSFTGKEIYDLAWSPSGDRLLAGSVDHTATLYSLDTFSAIARIAEHTNYVQGVAWDPLGRFVATQSSDRSMRVYELREKDGGMGVDARPVGRNSRMDVERRGDVSSGRRERERSTSASRTAAGKKAETATTTTAPEFVAPQPRPPMHQRTTSSRSVDSERSEASSSAISVLSTPLSIATTAATTAAPTTSAKADGRGEEATTPMDPPNGIPHHPLPPHPVSHRTSSSHSRRSSTSGSQPSQSPRLGPSPANGPSGRPFRSPSPAPLPAVMPALSPKLNPVGTSTSSSAGAAHLPALDAAASTSASASASTSAAAAAAAAPVDTAEHSPLNFNEQVRYDSIKLYGDANSTPFFRRLAWSTDGSLLLTPAGIWEDPYSVANAQASVKAGKSAASGSKKKDEAAGAGGSDAKPTVYIYSRNNIARPPIAHLPGHKTTSIGIRFCPVLWELREDTGPQEDDAEEGGDEAPVQVKLGVDAEAADVALVSGSSSSRDKGKGKADDSTAPKPKPKSLFDLPYRMVYAVATLDSVYLYDTQQAGPVAMFGNLHYAPFTDLTWSSDGQTLVISSQDGYCSIVAFSPGELGTPYHDQRAAHHHHSHSHSHSHASLPHVAHSTASSPARPSATEAPAAPPASSSASLPSLFAKTAASQLSPFPSKHDREPETPRDGDSSKDVAGEGVGAEKGEDEPPAKKQKKRVAPTLIKPL